jgi:ribosomal protein S18 acetylase RimI-like enzyme
MPRIRRYQTIDFVDYAATLEKTSNWGKKASGELEARLEKLTRKDQVWVAEIETRCVGFMILTPNDDGSLEVDWFDVHPGFQRTGIGTLLIDKALKVAKARGFRALSIHVQVKKEKAIGFATKNGFETFEKIKDFSGKREDALRLKKVIRYDV